MLALLAAQFAGGQDFASAASRFAAKLSEHATPGTASIAFNNRSSLSPSAVESIRAELFRQLQARGWKPRKAEDSEASIAVTLAENIRSYVWTAEITKAESKNVIIFESPRSPESAVQTGDRVLLSRTLLVSSEIPLLDVALLEDKIGEGSHLVALTPTTVLLYQLQSSQWRPVQTQPLGHDSTAARDLRGRIVPGQGSSFDAYLPGMHCSGVVTATLSVTCRESDDPWPIGDDRRTLAFYAANRNYFNGVISGATAQGGNLDPFYSAAILTDRIVYTGIDGRARVEVPGNRSTAVPEKWGSNMTGLQGVCQSDLLLAASSGDFNQSDSITAFRASNQEFVAASEPILFAGPVLNLKTSADRQQAMVVALSQSGRYEAFLLTARCGA